MPGNAMSLGSLFVELGLKTAGFNRDLGAIETSMQKSMGNIQSAARTMAVAFGAVFAGGVLAFKETGEAASDFQRALQGIVAISDASERQIDLLGDAARRLGPAMGFSAQQTVEGMEELIRGGTTVQEALDGAAEATIALAAAGRIDLASAADITTDAMQAFQLGAGDLVDIADVFAGVANKSSTNVQELTFAFRQSAGVAATVGLSIYDLIGAFGVLADAGLKGSDAGTSFRTMLLRLSPETDKAADEMKNLGIITNDGANRFFTAAGKLKPLAEIADVLNKALTGLAGGEKARTDALGTMFGQDAIRAAAALFSTAGKGVRDFQSSLKEVTAADVATIQMKGLAGSLKEFQSAINVMLIEFGEPLLKPLEVVVDGLKGVIDFAAKLPDWAQTILVFLMGGTTLVAGAGLVAALAAMTVPSIVSGITLVAGGVGALRTAIAGFGAVTGILGVLTGPIGLGVLALGIGALVGIAAITKYRETAEGLGAITSGLKNLGAATKAELTEQLVDTANKIDDLRKQLSKSIAGSEEARGIQAQIVLLKERLQLTFKALDDAKKPMQEKATALGDAIEIGMGGTLEKPAGMPAAAAATVQAAQQIVTVVKKLPEDLTPVLGNIEPKFLDLSDRIKTGMGPGLGAIVELREGVDPGLANAVIDAQEGVHAAAPLLEGEIYGLAIASSTRLTPVRDAFQDLSTDVRDVADAVGELPVALEDAADPQKISLFKTAWNTGFEGIGNGIRSLSDSIEYFFAEDVPKAFGEGFGGVLALQDSFAEGWTKFTDELKGLWSNALGDMVTSFTMTFTEPIGRALGELVSKATGLLPGTTKEAVSDVEKVPSKTTKIAKAIGYILVAEAIGDVLIAAGFENVPTPSRLITGAVQAFGASGAAGVRLTGKLVSNGKVPDAAWIALNAEAWEKTRAAYQHSVEYWEVSESFAQRALKSLHPHDRTMGTLRGVRLTTVTAGTGGGIAMPTQIGLDLLMNRGLTPEDLGVDPRWIGVGEGSQVAYVTEEGGVGFEGVGNAAQGAFIEAQHRAASGTATGTTTPAGGSTETTALTYPRVESMAQTFAQGMAVLFGEQERDVAGAGMFDFMQQTTLSRGLASVQGQIFDAAQSMGLSLGSIPIPGSGMTFGDLFQFYGSRGSYGTNNSNLITVNVDKFFGSDAEMRQLTDEIIRIARQEGLTLQPIT